jgi:membrane associated rhomboid family serine protease
MLALYSFSVGVGIAVGLFRFLIIYFASLTGGNILALLINRDNPNYRAVGASGAVSGVIFSSILFFPDSSIYILFLPIAIPSWLFGIGFLLISIYGIKSRAGNIGHEAHLGGAIIGILVSIIFKPGMMTDRFTLILMLLAPITVFLYLLVRNPSVLGIDERRGR